MNEKGMEAELDGMLTEELLTWKQLVLQRWREKAKTCPGRSEVVTECGLLDRTCCYANCIFRHWMEGI